jgi:hypothetical protein
VCVPSQLLFTVELLSVITSHLAIGCCSETACSGNYFPNTQLVRPDSHKSLPTNEEIKSDTAFRGLQDLRVIATVMNR